MDTATELVMGFDVGGTKTACVLVDRQGHVLGKGFGGSGNTNFIPLEIAKEVIHRCHRKRAEHGAARPPADRLRRGRHRAGPRAGGADHRAVDRRKAHPA